MKGLKQRGKGCDWHGEGICCRRRRGGEEEGGGGREGRGGEGRGREGRAAAVMTSVRGCGGGLELESAVAVVGGRGSGPFRLCHFPPSSSLLFSPALYSPHFPPRLILFSFPLILTSSFPPPPYRPYSCTLHVSSTTEEPAAAAAADQGDGKEPKGRLYPTIFIQNRNV